MKHIRAYTDTRLVPVSNDDGHPSNCIELGDTNGKGKRRSSWRSPSSKLPLLICVVGIFLVYAVWTMGVTTSTPSVVMGSSMAYLQSLATLRGRTLVLYVYSKSDKQYESNLLFFLRKGVSADDGSMDYVIIMQEGEGILGETVLPPSLPQNVRIIRHVNDCFDWGTFGWAVNSGAVDTSSYKYIIFLNSSIRGPFLPSYWPSELHWSHAFTSRINDENKLVGATISCEGSWKDGVLTGEHRQNPHVQSYIVAMDQIGLELLKSDPRVLKCYHKLHDAIWYAELGSSAAVLNAGYNIDSLMVRYQGLDWRDTRNWQCNAGYNPYAEWMYDGINISPFEVMFIKVKEFLLDANWTAATVADKYSKWIMEEEEDITTNEYVKNKAYLREVKIIGMRAKGDACFDYEFYKVRNPDLPKWAHSQIWEHFVKNGQHEGRQFRFDCAATQGGSSRSPPPSVDHSSLPPALQAQGTNSADTTASSLDAQRAGAVAAQEAIKEAMAVQQHSKSENEIEAVDR